jgi:DNA helicase II / ATP-dependent DNA helicase PcrA
MMSTSRPDDRHNAPVPQDGAEETAALRQIDAGAPSPERRLSISQRALAHAGAGDPATYLAGLNEEQRAAVEALDGPVLVLAGAGTGKTRVLTARIAHLLATGRARSHQILSVTFTNKAAREMKERIAKLVPGAGEGMPWLGTFHSIGVKILRRHAELADLKSDFTILDTDDQLRLLKQLIEAANIDAKRWPARHLANLIDGWKNKGITPDKVPAGDAAAFGNGKGAELYKAYQTRLKELNAADFGDLLLEGLRIFLAHPDVLAQYQGRFRYILVDEYQDTNVVQYLWLRLLAQGAGGQSNICCVGDDDQCVAADTPITMGDGHCKPIRTIAVGDEVLSCYGSGDFRPARVLQVHNKPALRQTITIKLTSGRELTSTAEHVHFAGYRLGLTPQTHFVYLMHKRAIGYRLGTSQVYTAGQKQPVIGFKQRGVQEHADAIWIVSTHSQESAARFEEMRLSLTYGLPTLPFVPRKGGSTNGLVHDGEAIKRLYLGLDTEKAAARLLEDSGLDQSEPHHFPRSRDSNRRNVVVTLCGDRRGRTPMHRLSIVGNDEVGARALSDLGFSVRRAKAGSGSWRVETAKASWRDVMSDIKRMSQAFPLNVVRQARFGRDNTSADSERASNSLPFIRAGAIRPGMVMFTEAGYDVVKSVAAEGEQREVVDIDVEATHNFVANGVVTHNSIYGWRGAEVDNILKFEKDFPGAKVVRLERNYRSTSHILATASHLITHNKGRLGKTLFTDQSGGEKVTVQGVWDDEEEARTVAGTIERLQKKGHKLNEMAILVRASFQMRAFEDRFVTTGLPYRVIGGPRFYERAEIKDACAYLELVANPAHDLKFERIVNVPTRGLGDATVKMIRGHARARELPLFAAARELIESEELKPRPRRALSDLIAMFERWRKLAVDKRHTDLAGIILDESGYTAMWQKDKTPQAHSRLENLKELIRFMEEFETLPAFLEHVALVMDVDTDETTDRVTLMTLHAAKGLEFDTVFLPGWEEGLFPHQRALDESGLAGLEEERRLAYVGITRAKKMARISFTQNRRVHALWQSAMPSRFVDELPEDHVEVIEAESRYGGTVASRFANLHGEPAAGFASPYDTPGWQRAQQRWKSDSGAGSVKTPGSGGSSNSGGSPQGGSSQGGGGFAESGPAFHRWDSKKSGKAARGPTTIEGELVAKSTGAASPYAVGARVFHDKFGYGHVLDIEGNKLTVAFDKAGEKKVLDSFVMAA